MSRWAAFFVCDTHTIGSRVLARKMTKLPPKLSSNKHHTSNLYSFYLEVKLLPKVLFLFVIVTFSRAVRIHFVKIII